MSSSVVGGVGFARGFYNCLFLFYARPVSCSVAVAVGLAVNYNKSFLLVGSLVGFATGLWVLVFQFCSWPCPVLASEASNLLVAIFFACFCSLLD